MSTALSTRLAGNLILARLLTAGKRPPSPSVLRADVGKLFPAPPSGEQFQEYIRELVDAGLVTTRPFRLTDEGRAQALEFLGVDALPPRANWKTVRDRYLVPKALDIPRAKDARERAARADGLAALLIKRTYDLPAGAGKSVKQAAKALACKELGYPDVSSPEELVRVVLSQFLGAEKTLSQKEILKQLPRRVAGASNNSPAALREAVLRRWVGGAEPPPAPSPEPRDEPVTPEPFDLPAFARTVEAAARDCPTGWFGDNKVFISHVWQQLRKEPGFPAMDLPTFKQHLTEANQAGLLRLERADLVQAMDPADVRESETQYLNAVFHFILVERGRP